jgi:hypothetical protein
MHPRLRERREHLSTATTVDVDGRLKVMGATTYPINVTLHGMAPAKFGIAGSISSSGKQGPIEDRTFEIEFLGPGVQALDFTFG